MWSRVMDGAFIATFLLSFPAAFLADATQRSSGTTIGLRGVLARSADGTPDAWLMNGQTGRAGPPATPVGGAPAVAPARTATADQNIIGNFGLSVIDIRRGWPLVTTIVRPPPSLAIDILSEVRIRADVPRDPDDEIQLAIESALQEGGEDEALAVWNQSSPSVRRQWWAWFPAFGAWWIMMFAIAAITIQMLRFASIWLDSRRRQREYMRRADNKCPACGYDMTGLDFHEKCPECGAHVW